METNRGLDLEKELTCSICTEVLYQPLTLLDCLHSFCGSCLKEWFAWQLQAFRNGPASITPGATLYTCPSCRASVRDTQHNSTITSLLDMFLVANPDKGKTPQEKADISTKYKAGENVLQRVEQKEKSLRERRVEDEDRMLMNEVRGLSLLEIGIDSAEGRERRRREEERPRRSSDRSRQDQSRDTRSSDGRERRRRREEVRRGVPGTNVAYTATRRTEERRRGEDEHHSAASQIEHQSSIRSLISSTDLDSSEIEEEILRQIREENLLEGIDLDNIDVSQEDQISERIAEAFRKRHGQRSREEASRRSDRNGRRGRPQQSSANNLSDGSDSNSRTSREIRDVSNSPRAASRENRSSRPSLSTRAGQMAHLEAHGASEERRNSGSASRSRSAKSPIPSADTQVFDAARSQTDQGSKSHTTEPAIPRPLIATHHRTITDPNVPKATSAEASNTAELLHPESLSSASRSPRAQGVVQFEKPHSPGMLMRSRPTLESFSPSSAPSAVSNAMADQSLYPAPLSPQHRPNLSEKATAVSSGVRPLLASSPVLYPRPQLYAEPYLTCARCSKPHVEYELHYNCAICHGGNWNMCMGCYRSRRGCLHWFGFGSTAWNRWEVLIQNGDLPTGTEKPHMLTANRYVPPKIAEGGADRRRTLTTEDPKKRLQSGTFCASCFAWTNECYWRCQTCNDGEWGFCNNCVNRGKSCPHPLLPLIYKPDEVTASSPTPNRDQQKPSSASILTGPGILEIGPFKPLNFSTKCDVCHYLIQPCSPRYHCFSCTSAVPNTQEGDYDICSTCYPKLVSSRRISFGNGHNGWRRCLQGHRMVVLRFEDGNGGQRRITTRDLVGGRGVREEPFTSVDYRGADLQIWSWGDVPNIRQKLVTSDVVTSPPAFVPGLRIEKGFPPDGGVGMLAVATWSWYPDEGTSDELMFPKGALVAECRNINDDWFHGTYMGRRGLFPSNYVKILDGDG